VIRKFEYRIVGLFISAKVGKNAITGNH
jgi:hypothetical protein